MKGLRVATWEEVAYYGKTLPPGLLPPIAGATGPALVGSMGAAASSGSPTWGTGESRTAGNLLIAWSFNTTSTNVGTPSGWSIGAAQVGTYTSTCFFYKVAAGGDAAPTGMGTVSQLAEFSGCAATTPRDRYGSVHATSGTQAATTAGVDAAAGELVVCASLLYVTGTFAQGVTFNNGAGSPSGISDATEHPCYGYGVTTGNGAADSATVTYGSYTELEICLASFLLGAPVCTVAPAVTGTTQVGSVLSCTTGTWTG